MTNAADQKPPNGITLEDLDKQTEQVKAIFVEQVESVQANSAQQVAQAESDHRISLLMEQIGSNEAATKAEVDRKFNKYFLFLAVAFGLLLAVGAVNYFQILNPQPGQSVFVLSDIRVTGPTDLCPGDALKFEFDVTVKEVGVYSLYMSTWKTNPPPSTIIFSEIQPFVIGSERSFPIVREWQIPQNYEDPANSKDTPMISGEYIRDISVTAVGRNTESTPLQVKFNIKEDCLGYSPSYHSPLYSNPLASIR